MAPLAGASVDAILSSDNLKQLSAHAVPPALSEFRRVLTPNARVHVVMTSLLDTALFPAASFADPYHSRWRVEEAFRRLKNRIGLEHTPA